jgi:hypothetical protein
MGYPRPNWYVFNRISLLPAVGLAVLVAGLIEHKLWLIPVGIAVALFGTWLTMRRLSGRISERSLVWVAVDTVVVLIGVAIVVAAHLRGWALAAVVALPALASDSIATAVTGVKEVR